VHGLIEDMIKVLETKIQPELRRGRYPDRKAARKVAEVVHAVARELEA
jgi:CspA family cold shock protein